MEILKGSEPLYTEHAGTVVDSGEFSHIMALTLDPHDQNRGLVRCISARSGDVALTGNVDESVIYHVKSTNGLEKFEITEPLKIKNETGIVNNLKTKDTTYLGLEDPDLILDPENNVLHLYFTIPFFNKEKNGHEIYLGHSIGSDIFSLEMTEPVLKPAGDLIGGAKEVAIAPKNSDGIRLNLVESSDKIDGIEYSTVQIGASGSLGDPWQFGKTVIHPKYDGKPWYGEHASPGPLLPTEFIDMGSGKRLGILNGRAKREKIGNKVRFGEFAVGLFIYNYENGAIEWTSDEPLIVDSKAQNITFASQFIQTNPNEGILYAHVDDSFIRAYTLYADRIRSYIK